MPTTECLIPPKPSQIPSEVKVTLEAKYELLEPSDLDIESIQAFQRAANYILVAMIFLKSNGLLLKDLEKTDLKPRLLGHFGTCPGIVFVWTHLTAWLKKHETEEDFRRMLFVLGPGHGAPGVLAPLYLEGSLSRFYSHTPLNLQGLEALVKEFSWPSTYFPSHVNAYTPGCIHEGGELGYSLSVSYGSVMDKPDLITVCLVGDGEAETGPMSASWHGHKFLDPKESGAVLPILHANGYKISERTLFGTMDDSELIALFTGYGYQVAIVTVPDDSPSPGSPGCTDSDIVFASSLNWAFKEIHKIQSDARSGKPQIKPRWPMIVLRSPKGWGGPSQVQGKKMMGSFRSHQVPLTNPHGDEEQFQMLIDWLKSYNIEGLFNFVGEHGFGDGKFISSLVARILPSEKNRLGMTKEAVGGVDKIILPDWKESCVEKGTEISAMKVSGNYLAKVVQANPKSFRIFSPDELASNKLDPVFEITSRNFQWDPETANEGGRVIEMLSEHTLEGFFQGYALTGRSGLLPSYEAFLPIVTTMVVQYAKFIKMSKETAWREKVPSLNFIETSTLWRQEHNGFSHQNPGLINTLLNLPHDIARIYLPPDANTWLSTLAHCIESKQYVNLMVGSKTPAPNWLSAEEAQLHCTAGGSVWRRWSTDNGVNPDVVLVGIGVETTSEVLSASSMLQKDFPGLRVRVVNVTDLMILAEPGVHPHALTETSFISLFTEDKPVIINFHGYPSAVESLLFGRNHDIKRPRIKIHGYQEEGTTTTPWSMLRINSADRYSLAIEALEMVGDKKEIAPFLHEKVAFYKGQKRWHEKYVNEFGQDPDEFVQPVNYEG